MGRAGQASIGRAGLGRVGVWRGRVPCGVFGRPRKVRGGEGLGGEEQGPGGVGRAG